MTTYNKYITEGVLDGTISEMVIDGVRIYKVRKPKEGEEVVGYINFSSRFIPKTLTQQSGN